MLDSVAQDQDSGYVRIGLVIIICRSCLVLSSLKGLRSLICELHCPLECKIESYGRMSGQSRLYVPKVASINQTFIRTLLLSN